MPKSMNRSLAGIVSILMLVSACSSSGPSRSSGPTPPATVTTTATASPVTDKYTQLITDLNGADEAFWGTYDRHVIVVGADNVCLALKANNVTELQGAFGGLSVTDVQTQITQIREFVKYANADVCPEVHTQINLNG